VATIEGAVALTLRSMAWQSMSCKNVSKVLPVAATIEVMMLLGANEQYKPASKK
jgi:hypothetical protein